MKKIILFLLLCTLPKTIQALAFWKLHPWKKVAQHEEHIPKTDKAIFEGGILVINKDGNFCLKTHNSDIISTVQKEIDAMNAILAHPTGRAFIKESREPHKNLINFLDAIAYVTKDKIIDASFDRLKLLEQLCTKYNKKCAEEVPAGSYLEALYKLSFMNDHSEHLEQWNNELKDKRSSQVIDAIVLTSGLALIAAAWISIYQNKEQKEALLHEQ